MAVGENVSLTLDRTDWLQEELSDIALYDSEFTEYAGVWLDLCDVLVCSHCSDAGLKLPRRDDSEPVCVEFSVLSSSSS